MKQYTILILLTIFLSCKNTNSPETPNNSSNSVDSSGQVVEKEVEKKPIYVKVNNLRIREKPSRKGKVIANAREGDVLLFLDEKTDFTEKIKLRGKEYDEPWLKISTKANEIGWAYGGGLSFSPPKLDGSPTPYDRCEKNYVIERKPDNFLKCRNRISRQQTKKDDRYIKETKTGYQVTLLSGEKRNLVNSEEGEEAYRKYQYFYYLDRMGYFVFKIDREEGGEYILMDDKFGYVFPIPGFPKASPDFKYILVTNQDATAGFEFNGIQLFGFTDGGLGLLWERTFEDLEPWEAKWIDEKNVALKMLPPSRIKNKPALPATLRAIADGVWKFGME